MNTMKKKIQADKKGCKYILFRIDIYLVSVFQQQILMKKDMLIETLFLKKKDKQHQKRNLVVNLLELIQVMQKNGFDSDYEVGNVEAFIDEFKNKKK